MKIINNNEVIIENGDLCPCGSQKKFKKCCKTKEYKYYTIGKNYKGQEIIYNYTLFKIKTNELINLCSNIQNKYDSKELKLEDAIRIVKEIYSRFDLCIEPFQKYSSCSKGCYGCCEQIVNTYYIESEIIKNYINENFNEGEQKIVIAKAQKNKGRYPKDINEAHPKYTEKEYVTFGRLPCIFLNDNGTCKIYKVRPFECRQYIVFNNPEDCYKDNAKDIHYEGYYFYYVRQTIKFIDKKLKNDRVRHLAKWFCE
ncbi:MAG: YkgJ family cysteine cluster protein [Caloramator sp.]|nr:YkgJ family cysteine cluster protein [Caloramator sp.]